MEFSFCVIFIKKLIYNSAGYAHVLRNNIRYGNYLLYHKDKNHSLRNKILKDLQEANEEKKRYGI